METVYVEKKFYVRKEKTKTHKCSRKFMCERNYIFRLGSGAMLLYRLGSEGSVEGVTISSDGSANGFAAAAPQTPPAMAAF